MTSLKLLRETYAYFVKNKKISTSGKIVQSYKYDITINTRNFKQKSVNSTKK